MTERGIAFTPWPQQLEAMRPTPMVERWRPGDRDPVGNPLRLCTVPANCPYPCQMTYPHLHSIIDPDARKADER